MRRQMGFTVIEVTIFLAISGLLAAIAFAGTSQLISRTQFTDGMNSVDSFLKRQYEEVSSGVNTRTGLERCSRSATPSTDVITGSGSSAPGATSCILLGKVIFFTAGSDTAEVRYVVGSGNIPFSPSSTPISSLIPLAPTIAQNIGAESYELPWGLEFRSGTRSDSQPVNAIAFIRSPESPQIYTFVYNGTAGSPTTYTGATPLTTAALNAAAVLCIDDQSFPVKKGAIRLGGGQGSASIGAVLENVGVLGC